MEEKAFKTGKEPQIDAVLSEWLLNVRSEKKYSTFVKYNGICEKYFFPRIERKNLREINDSSIRIFN